MAGRTTSLWSKVGDGIDYTFVYGPDIDRVIAGYRQLTGQAPMMPRWAFGLWQCRERYRNQKESIEVLDGFAGAGSPSTTSCRTGGTGPKGSGARTRSIPRASPTRPAGSARFTTAFTRTS